MRSIISWGRSLPPSTDRFVSGEPSRSMLPVLRALLDSGTTVVLDAIMSPAERDLLRGEIGADAIMTVSFTAPIRMRLKRLERRIGRTAKPIDVFRRDSTERGMGIVDVIEGADRIISNNRGIARFHDALHRLKLEILKR